MDLDEIADELYGLRQDEFTGARDKRAAEAKKAGEKELAKEIGALRRPTLGAWLINALARARPYLVDQLLQLGESMRRAQEELVGEELRRLSRRRTELIGDIERQAHEVAAAAGQRVNESMAGDLRSTFEAALADPEVASTVRAGRLTAGLSHSGFGLLDLTADEPRRAPARKQAEQAEPAPKGRARTDTEVKVPPGAPATPTAAERKQALAAAKQALADARAAAEEVRRRERATAGRVEKLDQRLARLEDELSGLRRERDEAVDELARLEAAAEAARDAVRESERELADVRGGSA